MGEEEGVEIEVEGTELYAATFLKVNAGSTLMTATSPMT